MSCSNNKPNYGPLSVMADFLKKLKKRLKVKNILNNKKKRVKTSKFYYENFIYFKMSPL